MKTKYYLAYGMNSNNDEMAFRCPNAINLGVVTLPDHVLEFQRHCNIRPVKGGYVDCVLWEITEDCEESLDFLEGYPVYYTKKTVKVEFEDTIVEAMTYIMPEQIHESKLNRAPTQRYYDMVEEGYIQNGIPLLQLQMAFIDTCPMEV